MLFPATVTDRGGGTFEVSVQAALSAEARPSRCLSKLPTLPGIQIFERPQIAPRQVSFKPEISATYGLAIVLNGTPLQGSPFKIRIRNDETIAGNCRLYGPGLTVGTAGQRNQFCIQGRMKFWRQGPSRRKGKVIELQTCCHACGPQSASQQPAWHLSKAMPIVACAS